MKQSYISIFQLKSNIQSIQSSIIFLVNINWTRLDYRRGNYAALTF